MISNWTIPWLDSGLSGHQAEKAETAKKFRFSLVIRICWLKPYFLLIFSLYFAIVPALNWRAGPEIARVKFYTRTNLPGGFGGPGGGFLVVVAVVALPLLLLLLKPPPGPPKPPGKLVCVEKILQLFLDRVSN